MAEKDGSDRSYYKRRRRPTIRCGCRAQIFLKSDDGLRFEINNFVEGHNHKLVDAKDMHFVRSNRKLTHVQQDIIYEISTFNLGHVKAFNIMRTKYGGYEEVGATKDDCKNFKQSLTCYIGEYDAEMIFCFGRMKFQRKIAFGDIISFDATFKTNKCNMVFVPFTAINNHCRNVTVGAALLSCESIESYSWILKVFLDSFGIAPKVGAALCNNEDFKRKICDIVWTDAISQSEFETQWELIMKEYDLETNKWLCDMFEMRYDWIPAYYMDEPLSVEFFSHFDHCMEIQRHNGRKNDHDTRYTHPDPVSETPFEKEAELMYTKAIFNDFQDEMYHIRSGVACLNLAEEEDFVKFSVFDFNSYVPGCLEVLFKKKGGEGIDSTISCGCKRFEHYGLLCRHSLYILNLFRVTRFPKKYMVDRWKRDAGVNPRTAPISTFGNDKYLKVKEISREITLAGEYLINSYATDVDELTKVRDLMNIMIKQADETRYKRTHLSKRDRFAAILGYDQPSEVTVRVPSVIKNKGCGSHKRIKSQKEIAISRSGKKYRECKIQAQILEDTKNRAALQHEFIITAGVNMDMRDEITKLLANMHGKKEVDELCKTTKLPNCSIELKTEFLKSIMS
ncbi:protein FAR1-RELATED SEQUENCE 5-like [Bidens hawaiensis]|uniref:protein FAR1-RELATED SEQUENCE 5-like n=1 Tax=Bidens hawaiensis TaxID=980011 RepID=UPI0040490F13